MDDTEMRIAKCERRLDDLYAKVSDEAVTQARIGVQLDSVLVALGKLEKSVETLRSRPEKRWENLVGQIISVLAAAAAGAMIGGIK